MATWYNSRFVIRSKNAFEYPGLMEDFIAEGGSISASNYKTVDNSTIVSSEATMSWVEWESFSSEIDEMGESFPVRS